MLYTLSAFLHAWQPHKVILLGTSFNLIYLGNPKRNVPSKLMPPTKYLLKPTLEGVGSNTIFVDAKLPSPTLRTGEAASNDVAPQ